MTVHIVEDDEAVADALSTVLSVLGYHPVVYMDGETFLAEASVSADDLVILDLGLPGVSGAEVARELKNRSIVQKIILISGKSKTRLDQHIREFPDMPLLRKPLSMQALADAVA